MSRSVIWQRKRVVVNSDPQRRCYNGCNFSEEERWTRWEVLEDMRFLKPGSDPAARMKFWRELNDYSISVGGGRSEYCLVPEGETP